MIQTKVLMEMDKNSEIVMITGQYHRLMGLLQLNYFCTSGKRRRLVCIKLFR